MTEYKFVPLIRTTDNSDDEDWNSIKLQLNEIIGKCQFITTNYGIMYHRDCIEGVEEMHRGPVIQFKDSMITHWYNITGGYKKIRVVKKEPKQPIGYF